MRHIYSVVRFVPDPAQGEAINVGIIAGSDASGDWAVRTVENKRRATAIDDRGVLPEVFRHLTFLEGLVDRSVRNRERLIPDDRAPSVGEAWLRALAVESRNILQFTEPSAVSADTADDAIDMIWQELIVEPIASERRYATKLVAFGAVKSALDAQRLGPHDVFQRASIFGRAHSSRADFVVHNGKAVQIAQCWSFQLPDRPNLIEEIKAWAWTVRDIRLHGGHAELGDQRITVDADTPVAAVYVPSKGPEPIFEEALTAFADNDVQVDAISFEAAGELVAKAAANLRR